MDALLYVTGTGAVLKALASEASFVKVVILGRRVEDAAALSAGLEYAIGDVIITLRGDLTSAPHDVSTLLNALLSEEGAGRGKRPDLVCGWRRDSTLTFRQKIVSKLASWLMAGVTQVPAACIPYGLCTSALPNNNLELRTASGSEELKLRHWFTQSRLRDFGSGTQAFHASLLETSVSPFSPALTAMAGATVAEVEVRCHSPPPPLCFPQTVSRFRPFLPVSCCHGVMVQLSPRFGTSSPQNRTTAATCKLAWAVLSSAFLTRFQQRPMQWVGPLGGLCLVGSAVFGAQFWRSLLSGWAAYGSWAMAWSSSASHFMAALELFIMGAQVRETASPKHANQL